MVNSSISMHSQAGAWERGQILKHERAEYGKEIVNSLSRQLVNMYGNGYSAKNLRHMMKFLVILKLSLHYRDNCHGLILKNLSTCKTN